ncbi:MAG: SDR family oxidoreductase [Haliangiales bacterium]
MTEPGSQTSAASSQAGAGERWVITGASSGVGQGLVHHLLADGAQVTACGPSDGPPVALDAIAPERRARVSVVTFDVRDSAGAEAAAAAASQPVDVLVACAGVFGPQRAALDLDFEHALELFAINALGPLRTARAFLPRLRRGQNPRIALVSSVLGSTTVPKSSNLAYAASKAALNKLTQGLAVDLAPDGPVVVAIEPGWVRTPMGGPDAPVSVADSASGIIATLRGLGRADSGRFLDYQGQDVPW